ncbi:hypothetical protein CAOG_008920 [Capsaspora owczarzaki ATCC 30864]|uniref:BolA-like protein n=2 Tax=Capsaspora owczarzaki (strain ATCC 30864) TaxID=595528 RepID=A0A0D2VV90_CAPO3|nr:hypothetical protein CAOG_008920 [Capsaspora owczarzaki ATCC 30864]
MLSAFLSLRRAVVLPRRPLAAIAVQTTLFTRAVSAAFMSTGASSTGAAGASAGPVQQVIEAKLASTFPTATHIQVLNDSYKHAVPRGSETHFNVVVVSDAFKGRSLIDRHRQVNALLKDELKAGVHALSIQAQTPEQWQAANCTVAGTPNCLGGDKRAASQQK